MKKSRAIALIGALTGILALGAPAAAGSDARIEAAARNSYIFANFLKGDDITVKSEEGIVTLSGTVALNAHKALARETVADIPGVKGIVDQLTVPGEPGANSDAWISDKLKITLLFHRSVSAGATEVEVKEGTVTLRGVAESQAQKDLTAEYATDIEGVKAVNNEMTVAPEPAAKARQKKEKLDDSSISAQVRMALLFHRSTSAVNTAVSTKRGVVTLKGKAANTAEKDLATKVVEDIKGVKRVNNLITIE